MQPKINEGLEHGDLARGLVKTNISIDRFKSKLGRDEDIVVINFNVSGKDPATDLMNFIEKGYNFVVDSAVSPGENKDGLYDVFVEIPRDEEIHDNVIRLLTEIGNLTENSIDDWMFSYKDQHTTKHPVTDEELANVVPNSPEMYLEKYPVVDDTADADIDQLKSIAGLPIKGKPNKDSDIDAIRAQAGII